MKRWEYDVVNNGYLTYLIVTLNELGRNGWEAVDIIYMENEWLALIKREVVSLIEPPKG